MKHWGTFAQCSRFFITFGQKSGSTTAWESRFFIISKEKTSCFFAGLRYCIKQLMEVKLSYTFRTTRRWSAPKTEQIVQMLWRCRHSSTAASCCLTHPVYFDFIPLTCTTFWAKLTHTGSWLRSVVEKLASRPVGRYCVWDRTTWSRPYVNVYKMFFIKK